jgi:hypothetical protein
MVHVYGVEPKSILVPQAVQDVKKTGGIGPAGESDKHRIPPFKQAMSCDGMFDPFCEKMLLHPVLFSFMPENNYIMIKKADTTEGLRITVLFTHETGWVT